MLRKNSLKYVGIALLGFSLFEASAASELEASQKPTPQTQKPFLLNNLHRLSKH